MFGLNDIGRFANTETDETVADHNILHAEQQFLQATYRNRCDGLPARIFVDDSFLIEDQIAMVNGESSSFPSRGRDSNLA